MEQFLTALLIFSTVSSLLTQAVKKLTDKIPSNLLAVIVSVIVGTVGYIGIETMSGAEITGAIIFYGVIMGIACAATSMYGYDKVKQFAEQIAAGEIPEETETNAAKVGETSAG